MSELITESQQLWDDTTLACQMLGFRDIDHVLMVLQAVPDSYSPVQYEAEAGGARHQLNLNPVTSDKDTSFYPRPGPATATKQARNPPFSIRDLLNEGGPGNGEV